MLGLILIGVGFVHFQRHFIDLPVYTTAALKIWNGTPEALYDLSRTTPGGFYYSYFFALLFIPFAVLGLLGRFLFLVSLFGAYFYCLRASFRLAGIPLRAEPHLLLTILLSTYSFNDALMTANIGIWLLALSLFAAENLRARPALSGALLAVAVCFKLYPLMLLGYFIWCRAFRVVGWFIAFFFFFFLGVPILANGPRLGWHLVVSQLTVTRNFDKHWSLTGDVFQNFPSTFARWASLGNLNSDTAYKVGLGTGLVFLVLPFLKSFRSGEFPDELRRFLWVIALAFVPLLTPVSWYNMGLFYLPLIAWAVTEARRGEKEAWIGIGVFAIFYSLATPDLIGSDLSHHLAGRGGPFLGVMALMGTQFRIFFKRHREWIL